MPENETDSTQTQSTAEIERLADQLERSFRGGAWHGPSVSEALEGLSAAGATRRPIPAAHDVAEITGHLTTWIEVAHRRIAGERMVRVSEEENFPAGGAADEAAWRATLDRLESAHRALQEAVLELDDSRLEDPVSGSDPTVRGLLLGVLQHNTYHAGQIVLLRKVEDAEETDDQAEGEAVA